MRSFIKKDFLLFLRDRKEIIITLSLPILLVIILNFAFAGLIGNDEELSLDLQLAVVNQDNEEDSIAQLREKLIKEDSVNEAEADTIVEQMSLFMPTEKLVDYLTSNEIKEWVTIHSLNYQEAIEKVDSGDLDGLLLIPKGFTVNSLYAAYTKEKPTISLQYQIDKETNHNQILLNIIEGFIDNVNFQYVLQGIEGAEIEEVSVPEGGIEKLSTAGGFTLSQYFTVAMGVLFSLFLAATIGTKTGVEIRQQVFNRIMLTNSNPIQFLIGKIVSTFCLVWLQILIVLVASHLILDVFHGRSATFWVGAIGVVTVFSLAISGLTAVFTSISLRMKNTDAANGIFMLVILLFGIMGGNFVPIYVFPDWLKQVGEWTPNGLSLSMMTNWIQFEELHELLIPSMTLIAFFVLCIVVSLSLYPKRGVTQ